LWLDPLLYRYANGIGLEPAFQRWVIEDGEPELHVGDVFDWPLTFWVDEMLIRAVERTKIASPLVGNYYRVNAEVIYISHDPTLQFLCRARFPTAGALTRLVE
jgi:hypothetical protein